MGRKIIEQYYQAFNSGDYPAMLALLADDVVHDINQGEREVGHELFAKFLERMDTSYHERLVDLVLLSDETGTRLAAEFTVLGTYLKADEDLPPAHGQTYRLPAATFFEVQDGKIKRVTTYYNLKDWLLQVASASP